MMRRDVLAMGAAVLAVAPVVISPLTVSAVEYLPSWDDFRSLYDYNTTDPTINFLYGDPVTGIWWKYYYSALMAVVEGVYINGAYEITPSNFSGVSGYYLYNGNRRFGSMYASGVSAYTAGVDVAAPDTVCWALQDGTLSVAMAAEVGTADFTITKTITNGVLTVDCVRSSSVPVTFWVGFNGTGICDGFAQRVTSGYYRRTYYVRTGGTEPQEFTNSADYIRTDYNGRYLLADTAAFPSLPTNNDYPLITADNALDYVENVLNPYIVENAPDLEPYLYDPYGVEPIYPTGETVQGMPKEWTVENPALPSYNLDLQLPTADYEAIDVSTPIEQNASGIRFWWAMLGTLLDHFGLKSLVVLACSLGLFLLVLMRLGR